MPKINSNNQNKEQLDVTIIIPAYNEEKIIGTCLESISKLNYPVSKYEVLIAVSYTHLTLPTTPYV